MQVNVGKGIEKTIDHTALPQAALEHAIMIGLRNILMDSHASITTEDYPNANERQAAAEAMVDKKLAALIRGEVRVQSTREGDPVRAEAMRAAGKAIVKAMVASGKVKKASEADQKQVRELAGRLIEKDASYMESAREYIAKQKTGGTVDLSALGL